MTILVGFYVESEHIMYFLRNAWLDAPAQSQAEIQKYITSKYTGTTINFISELAPIANKITRQIQFALPYVFQSVVRNDEISAPIIQATQETKGGVISSTISSGTLTPLAIPGTIYVPSGSAVIGAKVEEIQGQTLALGMTSLPGNIVGIVGKLISSLNKYIDDIIPSTKRDNVKSAVGNALITGAATGAILNLISNNAPNPGSVTANAGLVNTISRLTGLSGLWTVGGSPQIPGEQILRYWTTGTTYFVECVSGHHYVLTKSGWKRYARSRPIILGTKHPTPAKFLMAARRYKKTKRAFDRVFKSIKSRSKTH